jgi:hypothetical protein
MSMDRFVVLCCLIIGLLISIGSVRLGLGSFTQPEAGMLPFVVGLLIILLAVILLIKAKPKKETLIIGVRWKNMLMVIGCLFFSREIQNKSLQSWVGI